MGRKAALAGHPRRGEVHVVSCDPVRDREIAKTRPALVIQNDVGNRESDVIIVAAITTYQEGGHLYPVNVLVRAPEGGLKQDSVVRLDQIRTVDKERLGARLGTFTTETIEQINRAWEINRPACARLQKSFGLLQRAASRSPRSAASGSRWPRSRCP